MTKEEIKNKISMALKDPILQQGFECICKENADFEKAYNEAEELLDKQIEATYKLFEENKELKEELKAKQVVLNDFKSRVETVTDRFNRKSSQLTYAKTIIQDLLDNTDEYARQRAEDFLKENK